MLGEPNARFFIVTHPLCSTSGRDVEKNVTARVTFRLTRHREGDILTLIGTAHSLPEAPIMVCEPNSQPRQRSHGARAAAGFFRGG